MAGVDEAGTPAGSVDLDRADGGEQPEAQLSLLGAVALVQRQAVQGLHVRLQGGAAKGERAPRGAEAGAERRGVRAVAGDVADDRGHRAVGSRHRVDEVPAEEHASLAGAVEGGDPDGRRLHPDFGREARLEAAVEGGHVLLRLGALRLGQRHGGVLGEALHHADLAALGLRHPPPPAHRQQRYGLLVEQHRRADGRDLRRVGGDGARHARSERLPHVVDELRQEVVGELLLQLERGLHDEPLAAVGKEGRAGQQPQPLALDGEQGDEVAIERLEGDVADRPRYGSRPAARVEQRRRPDHPVERVARAVRLVERPRDLTAIPVAEQPHAERGDEPEDEDERGGHAGHLPVVHDHQRLVGGPAEDREQTADARTAAERAGDHDERDQDRRHADVVLLVHVVVERQEHEHHRHGGGGEVLHRARAQVLRHDDEPRSDGAERICRSGAWHCALQPPEAAGQISCTSRAGRATCRQGLLRNCSR